MKTPFSVRAEAFVKAAVMAYIGVSAGRAAFTHMHDWTMEESPAGTPDWFGWSNAVISELIPLVALLDIRAKRRAGKSMTEMKFPVGVLVAFVILSLAAQISQATHTFAGWLIAALPAVGFLVVTKMVLGAKPTTITEPATAPDPVITATPVVSTPVTIAAPAAPVAPVDTPEPTPVTAAEPAADETPTDEPVFAPWAIAAHTPTASLNGHAHTRQEAR